MGLTICLAPRGACGGGVLRSRFTCRVFGRASILASPSLERRRMTKMPPDGYPALQYLQSVRVSKLLLATRTTSPLRVEGRIDLLEILDVVSNRLLLVANFIQAPVYARGQAAKLLFCKPPFFAAKLRWIESRTSFNAAVIRSPGGFRGPPWSSLRMPRTAVQ